MYQNSSYSQPNYGNPYANQSTPWTLNTHEAGNYGESYEQIKEDPQERRSSTMDLSGRGRIQFIRKVYTILTIQIGITALACVLSMTTSFFTYQMNHDWLAIVCLVGLIVSQIAILCCQQGRVYPTNMLWLLVFTLCQAYFVSYMCGLVSIMAGNQVVLIAAFMTAVIVVACTAYAFYTETDFTTSTGLILVLSVALLCLGIVTMFTSSPFLHNLYCALGVIVFGFYLIIDTQMLMEGRTFHLTIDDYVMASFCLYVDIISIFQFLLQLLSNNNND